MDIGNTISDSIKYPLSDFGKLLILGIILIIPIVNFIGAGYFIRAIKSSLAGISELPSFDDVGELFVDGLKVLVVSIAYFIIPIILMVIAWILSFLGSANYSYYGSYSYVDPTYSIIALVLMGLAALLELIIIPFFLVGLANMAYNDSELGAAFKFSEIMGLIKGIGWGEFIIWYIILIVFLAIIGVVVWILAIIGIFLLFILIGFILLPLLFILASSYIHLFIARYTSALFASDE